MKKTLSSKFKGGYLLSSEKLLYVNKINAKNYTFRVLKEHLYTVNIGLLFKKDSYLIEAMNRVISKLQTNGLIHYWISKYIDEKYYNVKQPPKQAQKLTIDQLYGSFQMLFFGLFVSFISFLVEIIYTKIKEEKSKILLKRKKRRIRK